MHLIVKECLVYEKILSSYCKNFLHIYLSYSINEKFTMIASLIVFHIVLLTPNLV